VTDESLNRNVNFSADRVSNFKVDVSQADQRRSYAVSGLAMGRSQNELITDKGSTALEGDFVVEIEIPDPSLSKGEVSLVQRGSSNLFHHVRELSRLLHIHTTHNQASDRVALRDLNVLSGRDER
jgi:hypothetical protein